MIKKLFGIFGFVWNNLTSPFYSEGMRRKYRERRKKRLDEFPFKERRTWTRRFRDMMKHLLLLFLFSLTSYFLILASCFTGCASSQKQIDILSIPVPDGFRCEKYDNSRAFWVNEDVIASDAMDWYNKLWGWDVSSQDNTKILTKDKQKFRLSFGVYTVSGSSIEIIRIGKGGKFNDKVRDKKD
ncbi:MAG: hypothetical protein AB1393_09510 [Candidatus Edwardsbacteria bacterium]